MMTEKTPHPSERMTRRNGIRHYLLAHILDDQNDCKDAAAAIKKFYVDHSAARKSAYDGLKRVKGIKQAEQFLEDEYDRNDQVFQEMKRHERDNARDMECLEKISKTLHRQLGPDTLSLPPAWIADGPAETQIEVMQDVFSTLTDPEWHRYHHEAMSMKEKMIKALSSDHKVTASPAP